MLDDEDYPAYTTGRAAETIGCSPDFLRRLRRGDLIDPFRSGGGHHRYSRYQTGPDRSVVAVRGVPEIDQAAEQPRLIRLRIY